MLRILPLDQAQTFITRKAVRLAEAEQTVAPILDAVRKRGDEAVLEYARKFDGLTGSDLTIRPAEWRAAESQVTPEFMAALDIAAKNMRHRVLQRTAGAYPKIQVIQCAGTHLEKHFIGFDRRFRNIFVAENFRTAVFMDSDSFH